MKYRFVLFVIVLELLFHMKLYGTVDGCLWNAILFAFPFTAFVLLCSKTKYPKWNVSFRSIMLFLMVLYYVAQLVYHQVFGNFLSLKSIVNGVEQALDFGSTIGEAFLENCFSIGIAVVLWFVYVVSEVVYRKVEKQTTAKYEGLVYLLVIVFLPILSTLLFMEQGTGVGTNYDVKVRFHRTEQSMYRLGLLETLKKDVLENVCDVAGITESQVNAGYTWIEETFFAEETDGFAEVENQRVEGKEIPSAGEKERVDTILSELQSHILDIDFDTLTANAENEDVKDVHTYFSTVEPTKENAYTGLFEGYNLIYISAESFSAVAIDKERTPTLYKMQQEGFRFENFYTPSWYLSTIDGEYVNLLGQIPVEGDWSLQHAAENTLPTALGNQLKGQGYTCNAYHNHDAYYYDRTITHPKLGYTFKAVGSGLTFESMYPESDLELMEITTQEYIGKTPFHTYYMTMSGHLPYTYGYNSMAVKNREVVKGEWSENAACYLAANTELEYGVRYLVEALEQAGQLEKTLFVVAPDHYPYGLKIGAYDELLGKSVEKDAFEIYRNTCLIWSADMKNMEEIHFPVTVDKFCSNLDLLPTISNLMGLSYDSRFFAGRDILSEDEGLVMLKDQSFLTDSVRYNATTGEMVWAAGAQEDSRYLQGLMEEVQNRFYYSAKILELDYYKSLQEEQ